MDILFLSEMTYTLDTCSCLLVHVVLFLTLSVYFTDWAEGQVTEFLVATFSDYFTDVKM